MPQVAGRRAIVVRPFVSEVKLYQDKTRDGRMTVLAEEGCRKLSSSPSSS